MSTGMSMAGLRPEQGPPLAVPASFFLTAPVAVVAAGALLTAGGSSFFWTRFAGPTVALAHLGTLGLMAAVMLGALYQMIPVVAGAPVPWVRAAHAVHAGLVLAVAALAVGFATETRGAVVAGAGLLSLVFLLFLAPVALALARAPVRGPTVAGMRIAVLGLALVVGLGVWLGHVRGSGIPSPRYAGALAVHLTTGLVIWIGGLIAGVSFQVVPMFYLTPSFPRPITTALVAAFALGLLAMVLALALGAGAAQVALWALPAALAAWLAHPIAALVMIRRRRRKRADASLAFWKAGLVSALGLLPCAALAVIGDDLRLPVAFAWLALWGWGAMIVHGMLGKIVPFLVWFHRFSKRVGTAPVPSMKQLLPDRYPRIGFALHLFTLLLGLVALATGVDALVRATGIGLCATGAAMFVSVLRPLRHGARG
ncbi:MAG: hypothetical protein IT375_28850 [Polyangiaceae bacterium]|nr:hypothetical protein [Polyangiaceae bacterium]